MKRIWFGAALLVLLLVMGICGGIVVEYSQTAQSETLSRAAALAADGDWAAARSLSAQAKQKWEQQQPFLSALCHHEQLERINGLFAQLEVFSEARSASSFSSTCVYLACLLDALSESHRFNLQNFF